MSGTVGRFAPTPSGRMHLGNLMCALLSWLSARAQNGRVLLRIEDLDLARCAWEENTYTLIDDLNFLGLEFDGGYNREEWQSSRFDIYKEQLEKLSQKVCIYDCYCTRAELHSATAPHMSDGTYVYEGTCYDRMMKGLPPPTQRKPSKRIHLPDIEISFTDGIMGEYREHIARECGDFVLVRSDGVYAYQFAVVVDDALSGVTEVVRGRDLISSTPRQLFLYRNLGFAPPKFYHIPLLTDSFGRRLSKRDMDLDVGALREKYRTPQRILGILGYCAGLIDRVEPMTLDDLLVGFDITKIGTADIKLPPDL